MELNYAQEDFILEQAQEHHQELKQAMKDNQFNEWLNFNLTGLREDYNDDKSNGDFTSFCQEIFNKEVEEYC